MLLSFSMDLDMAVPFQSYDDLRLRLTSDFQLAAGTLVEESRFTREPGIRTASHLMGLIGDWDGEDIVICASVGYLNRMTA
jgi:hypothetical protein